ncbi:hypothetical protein GCM10010921_20920 [Microbacterium album]|uniref:Uncharacterized protein n=1 Tax=Microbacterium album TaxID=2053191 RepID=A0A917IFL7_9MICO|nr:hypothetical protein GCM10010921_20920 [Microbacterium album]
MLAAGGILGAEYLGSAWLGLLIGLLVALGLFIAFQSRRGDHPGRDEYDDGARL